MKPWYLAGGIAQTWSQLLEAAGGYDCLWQDLDGTHVNQPLPGSPPFTSMIHGWRHDGTMLRLRLDGEIAHVAWLFTNINYTPPFAHTGGKAAQQRVRTPVDVSSYTSQPFRPDQAPFTVFDILSFRCIRGSSGLDRDGGMSFFRPAAIREPDELSQPHTREGAT